MKRDRRAKIVATLGPASQAPDRMRALATAGVDMFRLNFSHGSKDEHIARFNAVRTLERELDRPIAILQDLQGPKIRLGQLTGGAQELVSGTTVSLVNGDHQDGLSAPDAGDAMVLPLPHPEVLEAISPGDAILIDDGKRRLVATHADGTRVRADIVYGGRISDRKGVNLPDTSLPMSPLTAKDQEDLALGLELGIEWVAMSFVQRPSDVIEARTIIGDRAAIMVKMEKPQAMREMGSIIALSDAIMVARGDLGVELPPEDVPGCQKELVRACRMAGKPVIIATQMLESMISSPTPTRAEASDVATAIYDGADAVMLSAESAAGQYPLEAVTFMDSVIRQTENHRDYRSIITALEPAVEPTVQHAVSSAAADVAEAIGATAIVAFTSSGVTASRIARKRPATPVLALSPNEDVVRRLNLLWGTHPKQYETVDTFREMVKVAGEQAKIEGFAERGDKVVIVAGVPFGVAGSTNNLRVIEVE